MEKYEEQRLLVKIARMYYEDDMTQSAIAKDLGIYRTTISRLLKKAREDGIVTIKIRDNISQNFDLERKLEKLFHLKEVILVPTTDEQTEGEKKKALGKAGAELLKRIVKDEDVIGFAWGSTLASMVGQVSDPKKRNLDFVPLVGGPGTMDAKYHVNTITYNMANDIGGTPHFIDAMAVVERKETKEDIVSSNYFKKIKKLWDDLTIAVVGIGAPLKSSNMIWTGFYGDRDVKALEKANGIGDICSRFFDENGRIIDTELHDRTIAIELERLKSLNYSIGIAESIEKVPSIIGALKGEFINILVTTDETASNILERME
ncbi:sugar-binding transcriptional regulator [Metabacillus arenae]|uniref:Sugar-binding transcriptional regulator n=1 Tax=Metabacillus arenae TaxID=2771434 RepID=A0A926NET6_9BACI|nr:sugar-binding transcriptional regulator [Metabacillus arenae]MBD1379515.1 sugar-binding transcriptional regulator [Metabacillus arenae]